MLTAKQEKFVQGLVKGLSQRKAYKEAFGSGKQKDETIDNKASKLFKEDEIKARYNELIKELEDKAIMNAKERMIWLTEVINDIQKEGVKVKTIDNDFVIGEGTADLNTKMKAIDILNKMSGEYITKIDADVNSDININIELTDD